MSDACNVFGVMLFPVGHLVVLCGHPSSPLIHLPASGTITQHSCTHVQDAMPFSIFQRKYINPILFAILHPSVAVEMITDKMVSPQVCANVLSTRSSSEDDVYVKTIDLAFPVNYICTLLGS